MRSEAQSLKIDRLDATTALFFFTPSFDTYFLSLYTLPKSRYIVTFAKLVTLVQGVPVKFPFPVFDEETYSTVLFLASHRLGGFVDDFLAVLTSGDIRNPWHVVSYYGGTVRGAQPRIFPITNTH